ncbi:MAG: FAD-dependent oxidoreductase [Patescibacteria group bacterium]
MEINEFSLTLAKKETLARDLLALFFERTKNFSFRGGQFVQFHIPIELPHDPPFVLRSYSIASTPQDTMLEFCVKLLPNGKASRYFADMQIGEIVTMEGPRGRFVIDGTVLEHVFIATGAGLAPIMGMIRDELENKKTTASLHLLFGVRTEEDIFWINRLEKLSHEYRNFSFQITLSQPDDSWKGLCGRVTAHLTPPFSLSAAWYLCGSLDMVKDARHMLTDAGISNEKIRFEIF